MKKVFIVFICVLLTGCNADLCRNVTWWYSWWVIGCALILLIVSGFLKQKFFFILFAAYITVAIINKFIPLDCSIFG